ncbi:MAG TPA: extracellular solute-binding protein [Anaerolineae bacterium]|nr:extracellular solute-binding protein [Anaerolineae bacterium]
MLSLKKLLGFIALALLMVGCGGEEVEPVTGGVVSSIDQSGNGEVGERPFAGESITILTRDGVQIVEPLVRRAAEFQTLTGAEVKIETTPFDQLYDQMWADLSAQKNDYQAYVFAPQWLVDYTIPGYLLDLTDLAMNDEALAWSDIAPFFRDFSATYEGRVYTIPLDGDFQLVYYRADLLAEAGLTPPTTWQEYIEMAAIFHNQDLNGDGEADYGSCIAKTENGQSYWMFWSIVAPYLQSQGTRQGTFFSPQTMAPLVNNEAFAAALTIYKETNQYGADNELALDVADTRSLFVAGRCALSIDWGDIGTLSIGPESQIKGKLGTTMLPGSNQVLERATGELVRCEPAVCPYALGGINHAPFAAFGGWAGGISNFATAEEQALAYAFLSYMSQPEQANEDVTIGITGYNPYRISQFSDYRLWLEAGMERATAERYLSAIGVSLNNPNMALDLRIPQNNRYQQEVLDSVLAQFLADELTVEETMTQIYTGWELITEEIGREEQLAAYRASLGYTE